MRYNSRQDKRMKRLRRIIFKALIALLLLLWLAMAGCTEAIFQLSSDSPIPARWKNDPRTRGWTGYDIEYETRYPDEVVAHICPSPQPWYCWLLGWHAPGCFSVRGSGWMETPQFRAADEGGIGWFSFDGIAERYEFVPSERGVTLRLLPTAGPAP